MAFWTNLFGRSKSHGSRCGACGKTLQTELRAAARRDDPFAEAVERVAGALSMPGYACDTCGTVVCRGCMPMDGSRPCPKCG